MHHNQIEFPEANEGMQFDFGHLTAIGYGPFSGQMVLVVDPMSRKLVIPVECTSETLARFRVATPSLCMLHLNGRCRQGPNCHQVHADPNVIQFLRGEVQRTLMCCAAHGDPTPMPPAWIQRYRMLFHQGSGTTVPLTHLALTNGLLRLIDEKERKRRGSDSEDENDKIILRANVSMICRLHGQDRCRFNEECKFIHLCKDYLWNELNFSQSSGRRHSGNDLHQTPSFLGQGRMYEYNLSMFSCDSLASQDLTASPPRTPTSPNLASPIIKCNGLGDSWSYEPYRFNPIAVLPPSFG